MCGAYVYLLFMCMALIAFSYTMFRLPETKGRTFDDIAAEFRGAEGIPLHNKTTFNTFTWSLPALELTRPLNSEQMKLVFLEPVMTYCILRILHISYKMLTFILKKKT